MSSDMTIPTTSVINLSFTTEQLEKMLSNSKVGGLVQVKIKINIQADGEVQEVILR